MSGAVAVIAYSLAWAGFGLVSGSLAHRVPLDRLDHDSWLTRLRPFEVRGRWYDRWFGVRRWKDRLPEAGGWLAGGWAKDRIRSFAIADLERLTAETRRAEWVHWSNVVFGATFLFWTAWPVGTLMLAFGSLVHLPFVMVQRYNRARLVYVIDSAKNRVRSRAVVRP